MDSKYAVKVNGKFLTNVIGKPNISLAEVAAFVRTVEPSFDREFDTLEVECIDAPISATVPFRTNAYMQVDSFAVELHLDNLINTFGPDMVLEIVTKKLGRAA